jgi:hypothetical protein
LIPTNPAWVPFTIQTIWPGDGCGGVGFLDAYLHGSQTDPRVAWLDFGKGGRREVVFPIGYTARFMPKLEILNEKGEIVGREGDAIDGGCVTGVGGPHEPMLILWP